MRWVLLCCLTTGFLTAGDKHPAAKAPKPPKAERPIEKLEKMTPAQRQKALEKVAPERRDQIQQRLDRMDKLSPEEKARVARFRELPPEKQQAVRQAVDQMTKLPPDRQQAVRRELRDMNGLPLAERRDRMNSSEFKARFNGHERKLIEKLSDVVPD